MLVFSSPVLVFDQSKRHALHSAVIDVQHERWANEVQFFQYLNEIEVSNQALFELQDHGFLKSWLPPGEFHKRFPLGSQVNKYESTTAWAYTQGSVFAYKMNALMCNHDWLSLFREYGHCVKALYSYCDKMQGQYGEPKTLYRGLVDSWGQFQEEYKVGKLFTWASFTSVSESRDIAVEFANGKYYHEGHGGPILFEISTLTRGAPLLSWSKYPREHEILLQPFQGFEVVGQFFVDGMLVLELQTMLLPKRELQLMLLPAREDCVAAHVGLRNHYGRAFDEPNMKMPAIAKHDPCLDFLKGLAILMCMISWLMLNAH